MYVNNSDNYSMGFQWLVQRKHIVDFCVNYMIDCHMQAYHDNVYCKDKVVL